VFGLGEPLPTPLDLRFNLFRFPVRIHPFFWIISLIMGSNQELLQLILIWVVAIFISILVHELGHAFAFRYFGTESHIVLHGYGGLCIPDAGFTRWDYRNRDHTPREQIIISAAGPAAGFLLAAVVVGIVYILAATQGITYPVWPHFGWPYLLMWVPNPEFVFWTGFYPYVFIHDLLFINIFWGLVNLLPVLPLDGGQIAKSLFDIADHDNPTRSAQQVSVVVGIVVAVWAISQQSIYIALMFGMLAYQNYAAQQSGGYGDGNSWR